MKEKNFSPLGQGIRAGLPIAAGYLPIAVAFGALAVQAGLTWWEGTLMSLLVYAGASQFVGVGMLLSGADLPQIVAATFFLNLRHLLMSLSLQERFQGFSLVWKWLLSFGITDESFARLSLGNGGGDQRVPLKPRYTAGLMFTAYCGWVVGTALGGLTSGFLPGNVTEAMTAGLYALFIALLVPALEGSWVWGAVALISMAANTLLSTALESGWSIVLATLLASLVGVRWGEESP